MAGCELDFSALPILTGCPGDAETFLVGNAVGGLDVNGMPTIGYARRMWSDIKNCAAQAIEYVFLQFTPEQIGSPLPAGQTVMTVNQTGVLQDSVAVIMDGVVLDRNDVNTVSYTIIYGANSFTITLNQAAQNGETYVITYAFIS